MQTIVYQCDTAMPAQKLPNCCYNIHHFYVKHLISNKIHRIKQTLVKYTA